MKRILVADDEKPLRDLYSRLLTRNRYVVEQAANGTEAREKIYSGNFDGAVFDNNMGSPRGIEILEQLRKDGRRTPVLICCSPVSDSERAQITAIVERSGNAKYLEKPVGMDTLEREAKQFFGDPNV